MTAAPARPASASDPTTAQELTPRRPHRRLWLVVAAAVAAAGAAGWLAARDGTNATADVPATAPPTTTVARQTLGDTRRFTGILGHGEAITVTTPGQGVLTGVADQRTAVTAGTELFRIDERPVTAMYGSVPMYRDLRSGDTGADVAQLEANLAALGYSGFTVDDQYTSATAAAVRTWQADIGVPETGVVARADVVFVPQGTRVDTLHARVGDLVAPGIPVLDLTGTDQVVSLEVAVRDRDLLAVGGDVAVRLPDGLEVPGTVTAANAVPAGDGSDDTVIRVEVTLAESVDEALFGATGHPHPLLLRDRRVVRALDSPTTLPVGIGGATPHVSQEHLEPGDRVLFFTDGIVEERMSGGEPFGEARLIDQLERAEQAGGPVQQTVRQLSHALMRGRSGATSDDATLFLLEWRGGTADHLARIEEPISD